MVSMSSRPSGRWLLALAIAAPRSSGFVAPSLSQLARSPAAGPAKVDRTRDVASSHAQRVARAAAPVSTPAPPAPVDRRIQLAKAFVVDDFGRANPDLLQDDFAFELGSSLLTKERYLKSDDLVRLREACGDTLRVAASDFRIDPGDDEAVLFTLAVSGVQSAPYKGLEDKDPLKGSGPWKTLPTCGRCAFDASGKCYSATLGAPLDRCILRGDHFNLTWTPSTACLDSSLTQGRSLARRGDAGRRLLGRHGRKIGWSQRRARPL